jgi:PAS domain S-box-containing protein
MQKSEIGGGCMEDYLKFIKSAWERFVATGCVKNAVNPIVAESWQRCRKYGVNPEGGEGKVLNRFRLQRKLEENRDLISTSHPIMENIYSMVAGSGFVIILTDKEGYLIDVIGDDSVLDRARELNFIQGALWTEKEVGTNAIGTCLFLDKPIQIIGAEHFCRKHHPWTCSAAPIHDADGNLIGCLNMSGSCYDAHSHTLGIVLAGAFSIEKQMDLIDSHKLIDTAFDSIFEGIIITDEKMHIKKANSMAEKILGLSHEELLKADIGELVREIDLQSEVLNSGKPYYGVDCNFYANKKRITCTINAIPIASNSKSSGMVITFKEEKYIHNVVNKVAGFESSYCFDDIKTRDSQMLSIMEDAKKAALSGCSVLIEGASGTGKELFAQAIHNHAHPKGPFVAVNCASLPRDLMESELFGYEKGAFTGARKEGHPGKFELADGGTIFLDEIGELPLDLQSKLLRVLDNSTITRIGGVYEKKLNVRVIAATNRDLKEEVKKKNFREDLYYRLNVIRIKLPRLVERKEDIELLANYFLERLNRKNSQKPKSFSNGYVMALRRYDWPGNVRELQNAVERSYYLCESSVITEEYLPESILGALTKENWGAGSVYPFKSIERDAIKNALLSCGGNVVKAAEMLKISRATIYRKIKKYNIEI